MVPWVLYITSHNSPPKYLEIKISILLVEEVKLTQADSNHLPHGQASKWWSDRNLVLLNEGGGGDLAPSPEALAITCPPSLLLLNSTLHHLTTPLTLTSADDPFLTTNMAGGTGKESLVKSVCKGEPSRSLRGPLSLTSAA